MSNRFQILCYMCSKFNKSIAHIASGCPILLNSKYKKHHDKICTYLHWCILQDHDVPVFNTWHTHNPQPATKISDHITLHYNMALEQRSVHPLLI
eukprot:13011003-Ditylum_brightwellii.AAC.1